MNVTYVREIRGDNFVVFHFDTVEDSHDILFRLKDGHGLLKNLTTDELILSRPMDGFEGGCSIADVLEWSRINGASLHLFV